MKADITNSLLNKLEPQDKPYDVCDNKLKGFLVRVNKSGKLVYMCQYKRGKRIMVGRVGIVSLTAAREEARRVLADAVNGIDPKESRRAIDEKKSNEFLTLKEFIDQKYAPWLEAHRTGARETLISLRNRFCEQFGDTPLNELTLFTLEEWCTHRLKSVGGDTINRNIAILRSALNRAIKWKLLDANPLVGFEHLKTEKNPIVRYLEPKEEKMLRETLRIRNEEIKAARCRTNEHRKARKRPLLPDLVSVIYADYLYPMALLSMNAGIRRGELFRLTWEDVDLDKSLLAAKSRKSRRYTYKVRYIPLNSEVLKVLNDWYAQCPRKKGAVFMNEETGKPFTTIKKAWNSFREQAKLKNFRWHDFRHHFASSLVMAGVDINTVRELLGHEDIKMTLRYAHLAPEHKANAVEKLVHSKKT